MLSGLCFPRSGFGDMSGVGDMDYAKEFCMKGIVFFGNGKGYGSGSGYDVDYGYDMTSGHGNCTGYGYGSAPGYGTQKKAGLCFCFDYSYRS